MRKLSACHVVYWLKKCKTNFVICFLSISKHIYEFSIYVYMGSQAFLPILWQPLHNTSTFRLWMTESECEAKEVKAFLYRICEFVDTLTFHLGYKCWKWSEPAGNQGSNKLNFYILSQPYVLILRKKGNWSILKIR